MRFVRSSSLTLVVLAAVLVTGCSGPGVKPTASSSGVRSAINSGPTLHADDVWQRAFLDAEANLLDRGFSQTPNLQNRPPLQGNVMDRTTAGAEARTYQSSPVEPRSCDAAYGMIVSGSDDQGSADPYFASKSYDSDQFGAQARVEYFGRVFATPKDAAGYLTRAAAVRNRCQTVKSTSGGSAISLKIAAGASASTLSDKTYFAGKFGYVSQWHRYGNTVFDVVSDHDSKGSRRSVAAVFDVLAEAVADAEAPSGPGTSTPVVADATGSTTITDSDGYSFDLTYSYFGDAYEKDISDEKPGFSSIRLNATGTISVSNTTTGRNLEFQGYGAGNPDSAYVMLQGIWPATSAICSLASTTGVVDNDVSQGCSVPLGGVNLGELAPNHVASGTFSASQRIGGAYRAFGLSGVPDASYQDVLDELKSPPRYEVTYWGSDAVRFVGVCQNADLTAWMSANPTSSVNRYNNMNLPIYSSDGSCTGFGEAPTAPLPKN